MKNTTKIIIGIMILIIVSFYFRHIYRADHIIKCKKMYTQFGSLFEDPNAVPVSKEGQARISKQVAESKDYSKENVDRYVKQYYDEKLIECVKDYI